MQSQSQDHLASMRAGEAPIPLVKGQALGQARRLRLAGMTYTNVAIAMTVYHGITKTPWAWRRQIRAKGVPAAPRYREAAR